MLKYNRSIKYNLTIKPDLISYKLKQLKTTQYIARNTAPSAPLPSTPSASFSRPPPASASGFPRANRSSPCYPSLYVAIKAACTPNCRPLTVSPCPSASSLLLSSSLSIPCLPSVTLGPFSALSIPKTARLNSKSGGRALTTKSLGPEAILRALCGATGKS